MQEWSNKNKFNSFNSWKGLLYMDWYKAIVNKKFLPPIEAAIAPIHTCNLNCKHCNSHSRMKYGNKVERMEDNHLIRLIKFLALWGVKAVCFAGSGEPTLHTKLPDAIIKTHESGMCLSILTNGTNLSDKLLATVSLCTWIGVSVDSATPETFKKLKGKDCFNSVIKNVEKMSDNSGKCDIAFKFLVSSVNQHEIYKACKLAKNIGVRDFHARPMDFFHEGIGEELIGKLANIDIDDINEQFAACHELETEDFHVFTVIHKFNPDFSRKKEFKQCYGAPLSIPICADGKVYLCIDQWDNPDYVLGTHYPDPYNILKFWGNKQHIDMIYNDTPSKCKTRCTFGVYSRQCEELLLDNKHPMYWKFP